TATAKLLLAVVASLRQPSKSERPDLRSGAPSKQEGARSYDPAPASKRQLRLIVRGELAGRGSPKRLAVLALERRPARFYLADDAGGKRDVAERARLRLAILQAPVEELQHGLVLSGRIIR